MYRFSSEPTLKAVKIIKTAKRLVAFTGSGMSKESGIPTFRDPGGLWERFDPKEVSFQALTETLAKGLPPKGALVGFLSEIVETLERASPNPGHRALKHLEEMGILKAIITQNIDNLHQEAGNSLIIELHGNVYRFVCLGCQKKRFLGKEGFLKIAHPFIEAIKSSDISKVLQSLPWCECGGVLRPDVVGFGEPVLDFERAIAYATKAGVFLIVGTSGEVMPAARLPSIAKRAGAKIIEINPTSSAFQNLTDIYIQSPAAIALPDIVQEIA